MSGALDLFLRALGDREWVERAECRDKGTDHFFLNRGQSPEPAFRMCRVCPVTDECKAYADMTGTEDGIWAGVIRHSRK